MPLTSEMLNAHRDAPNPYDRALVDHPTPPVTYLDGFRDALQAVSDECGNEPVIGWGTVDDVIAAIRKDAHFYYADRMTRIAIANRTT